MSEQHGGDHEHGAAGRNGHMGDSTVQTVQVPGTLEVSGGQYSQGGIGPNQEYRLAPQVGQLDAGTCLGNKGCRAGQMDLDARYIQAPALPPGGTGVNPERAPGAGILPLNFMGILIICFRVRCPWGNSKFL